MSNQALADRQNTDITHSTPSDAITPMQMLSRAVEQGADIDKLEKLMALQERWEANEARKAWNHAMNALKSDPPKIMKNKHVDFQTSKGRTQYDHASLDHVTDEVSKAMAPHGLSFRWETGQDDNGVITVTCIVSHKDGHSERTTLSGGADQSGGKNNIQAIGSAVTYLERYTLKAALGIAEEDQDDDGAATSRPAEPHITDDLAEQINQKLKDTGSDTNRFLKALAPKIAKDSLESVNDIPLSHYGTAINLIEKNAKKKQAES